MHGRPRPVPGAAVDPEKAKAAKQRVRGNGALALAPFSTRSLSSSSSHARPTATPHPQLALLSRLNDEVLTRRAQPPTPASLSLTATLLEHNPEACPGLELPARGFRCDPGRRWARGRGGGSN